MRLAICDPHGAVVMLSGTEESKQSYGKLFELVADCTVRPQKDTKPQTATFMFNEFYFNDLRTITNLFQHQQFIDHFETDTTRFTMMIL